MKPHCWHVTEPQETYSTGWESSTKVICCWCAAMGYKVERRIGRDRVDGHGPFYEQQRYADRVDIRFGSEHCPQTHQLFADDPASQVGSHGNQSVSETSGSPSKVEG